SLVSPSTALGGNKAKGVSKFSMTNKNSFEGGSSSRLLLPRSRIRSLAELRVSATVSRTSTTQASLLLRLYRGFRLRRLVLLELRSLSGRVVWCLPRLRVSLQIAWGQCTS